jgi:hypothetical protein
MTDREAILELIQINIQLFYVACNFFDETAEELKNRSDAVFNRICELEENFPCVF